MISQAPAKSSAQVSFIRNYFVLFFLCISFSIQAQTFSAAGFSTDTLFSLPPYKPVGLTFAPDGRMFVWQENGIVRIYKNGTLLATPFVDISSHVNIVGDRGMLGLVLDPDFAVNGYVYLFYSYEPTSNPNDVGPRTERLTRVKADPANPDVALANSETLILGSVATAPCGTNTDCIENISDSHTGGSLRFGPDRKLYISTGDGSNYNYEDPNALKCQDLNYFNGKIIRINPDGTAPSDNPFYDGTNSIKSKIYAYGLRNPFRVAVHPTSGEILIADVGWSAYEEVNRGRGANFGWPCYEGNSPQISYQAKFPGQCGMIPASAVTNPIYFYPHSEGQAIIGGTHYTGTQFPAEYRGNYFFADYPSKWIKRLVFDANRNVSSVQPFATNVGDIVAVEIGPDGALYFVELSTGKIKRIRYASAPSANATASPTAGVSPLTVNFSSAGSSDPNGLAITYLWDFGDGTTSTEANPLHTYVSNVFKAFTAKLTVTNSQGGNSSATVIINVGNRPPVATIATPVNNTLARPGDTINYAGSASDPDETLSASAMSWQLLLHHDAHVHPFQAVPGASGSFVVEDHGAGTYYYEIILTVTDSRGATDTKSVNVNITTSAPVTAYLSDLTWASATNGWGPVEKDKSNADLALGDGLPLTLNGTVYPKGLGVHANSDVRFNLNGAYSTFAADIGVDDEVESRGSVIFQVFTDGVQIFDSGVLYGNSPTQTVNLNVTGKNELRLVVLTTPDGDPYDHADWANARLLSGSAQNQAPTVSITAPSNGATFNAPVNITLTANASDADGTISKVEFFNGATLLGTSTTTPYSFAWRNITAGNYSLSARATDNKGTTTTSAPISISVNAPSGSIYLSDLTWASATNGWGPVEKDKSNADLALGDGLPLTLNGTVYPKGLGVHANSDVRFNLNGAYSTFAADIGVDDEVESRGSVIFQVFTDGVQIFDSGVLYGNSPTQTVNLNVTGKNELRLVVLTTPDGDPYDHADWANARLLSGAPQNNSPSVNLTAPANNATYNAPASVTLTANAADTDGTISKVEFFNGATLLATSTSSPYTFAWNNVGAGNYNLTAKATDNAGTATTSTAVNISVTNNAVPSVSLTAPTNNAVFTAPATLTLTASASDADGTISKVEFYSGTTLLGTAMAAPYAITWNNIAAGSYSLTAKAFDNSGATKTSSAISITINAAPTSTLPAPWNNQDIGATSPAGAASFSNGVFTLKGSGNEIWDYVDAFQFAYQTMTGDGQITARVLSQQNTFEWAEAGVMIRASLANNAPYSMVALTPTHGVRFQWRYLPGGNTGGRGVDSIKAPYWVRLVRTGNILTGYYSADGVTWKLLSAEAIPNLPNTLYFGLVSNSHTNGVLCTTTFDRVTIGR